MKKIDLSPDERLILKELTESSGWQLYLNKVWKPIRTHNIERCRLVLTEHRYAQGFDQGFEFAKTILYTSLKPPVEEEVQQNEWLQPDSREGV